MKYRQLIGCVCLVVVTAAITSQVVSQDQKGQMPQGEMPEWMKYSLPGEHHKAMEPMLGKWEYTSKIWMDPAQPPMESPGTIEYKSILDGRYIVGKYRGTMMGEPFEGTDIMGYDNFRGEYVTIWLDNHSTAPMITRGQFDPATKKITMMGKADDMMTGRRDAPIRTVTDVSNPDRTTFTMYCTEPDGKESKCLEVSSTRAK
jgi:hypothetical protein